MHDTLTSLSILRAEQDSRVKYGPGSMREQSIAAVVALDAAIRAVNGAVPISLIDEHIALLAEAHRERDSAKANYAEAAKALTAEQLRLMKVREVAFRPDVSEHAKLSVIMHLIETWEREDDG